MADESLSTNCRPKRLASTRRSQSNQVHAKQEVRKKLRKVSNILKKKETERTEEEIHTLHQLPDVVKTAEKNAKRNLQQKERILEIEDEPDVLDQKCQGLAQMLLSAENAVVYTGAGISTAASIPDYRGPNGVWTLLRKGQSLSAQDLVDAEPTYTHMCITKLFKMGRVKYLVSQNCDGLHIRSGFPRSSMSEVHGNMFIEICKNCRPQKQYLRLFDVTERTAKRRHKTGRMCSKCKGSLTDSIVHFGEKGGLKAPYRWKQAVNAVGKSDLIICLGSSLKVLRRYPCLWRMDIRPEQRPKLVIVNLQWTPKDEQATLKIHGRCDDVLKRLAEHIGITVPPYRREADPLVRLHTPVQKGEEHFANKKSLKIPAAFASINQRKAFHKVPLRTSTHQPPPLLKSDNENRGRNSGMSPTGTAHSLKAFKSISNFNHNLTFAKAKPRCVLDSESCPQARYCLDSETASENKFIPATGKVCVEKKILPHLLADCVNGASSPRSAEGRHIPDPLRIKLEQMLVERGVMNSTANLTCRGSVPSSSDSTCRVAAPLLSVSDFLCQGTEGRPMQQHTHPASLGSLLSFIPVQPQASSVDQEVFRVDLSTSPVSISTSLCAPDLSASQYLFIPQDSADTSTAAHQPDPQTTSWASTEEYAKCVRNIHFDHSYSKSVHKASASGKVNHDFRDSLSCSLNTQAFESLNNCLSLLAAASVIPSSSQGCWTTHQSNSQQDTDNHLQKQLCSMNPDPVLLDHRLPHVMNLVSIEPQDKVIVNLNAGSSLAFDHRDLSLAGTTAQPSVSSSGCDPTMPAGTVDEDLENHQTSGRRKKPVSVPGWFGKGLRVRRKRSL
ncbi:hypothetical protein ACOMHN_024695 [Nucella lapillus]